MFSRALHVILREEKKNSRIIGLPGCCLVHAFSSASGSGSQCQSQRLAGKVAVITGGASGIGKATAAEFVRNGARVVIADVQDDLGRAVAAQLSPGPDNMARCCCYTHCDVADEAQVAAAVDLAVARHGRLDVMFNNAGIGGNPAQAPLAAVDLADFDRVMAVNGRGVLAGLKHAARVMVPRRRGSIICTASVAAFMNGGVANLAYCASKAAAVALVRAVAAEMARSGVRVNAISPYAIPTPLTVGAAAARLPGWSTEEIKRMVEVDMNVMHGTKLEVEDIARAALYLASDDAKYVNGHNLVVDGGFTVSRSAKNAAISSTPQGGMNSRQHGFNNLGKRQSG